MVNFARQMYGEVQGDDYSLRRRMRPCRRCTPDIVSGVLIAHYSLYLLLSL